MIPNPWGLIYHRSMSNGEDFSEKTTIISGETLGSQFQKVQKAPPSLVIVMGPVAFIGKQFFLDQPRLSIGRSVESNIQLLDRSVSRNHAEIKVDATGVYITDLNSANKTYVNEVKLQPNVPFKLRDEDQIKMGNFVLKFFEKGNLQSYATQKIIEKSLKDPLTGAYSKAALLERAPQAVRRSMQTSEPLTLIIFDIDHFKKINDQYGHPGGDSVLRELGQFVSNSVIRQEDFFARYGGEEFIILLIASSLKVGAEVAERLRVAIQKHDFFYNGVKIPVTISLGVGQLQSQDGSWENFFDRVDKALYQSKQSGRNRVTLAV